MQQIIDFMNMISDFFASVWSFVWSFIQQLIEFFILIGEGAANIVNLVNNFIPSELRNIALGGVTATVLFMILGRSKGGD